MHRLIENFSHGIAECVTLVYLVAGSIATAYFFSNGATAGGIASTVAVLVAIAVEAQFWLEQRILKHKINHGRLWKQDGVLHLGISTSLMLFGIACNYWYLGETWAGHDPVQRLVRASVVYVFYLLASALTPETESVGDLVKRLAIDVQYKGARSGAKQWRTAINRAVASEGNLSELLSDLLAFDGDDEGSSRLALMGKHISPYLNTQKEVAEPQRRTAGYSKSQYALLTTELWKEGMQIMRQNPRTTVRALADALGISRSSAHQVWQAGKKQTLAA